jgi:glutamine amidotransferase-like uncharacterized protein
MTSRFVAGCWFWLVLVPALLAAAPVHAAPGLSVGVYAGDGSDPESRAALLELMDRAEGVSARAVAPAGEVPGAAAWLEGLDVLVVGGGSGTAIAKGLGAQGAAAVAEFVRGGGGYLGIGAGAFLAARGYNADTRRLELLDAHVVDRSGGKARGHGEVELESLAAARHAVPPRWLYRGGPLLVPGRGHGRRPYVAWARYRSDLSKDDSQRAGLMPAAHAIVAGEFGAGRVVLLGVVPLGQPASEAWLGRALGWASGRGAGLKEIPAAPSRWVRVAVLDDAGCIASCVRNTFRCLDGWVGGARFSARRLTAADLRAGALADYDVVVLPGGSATKQSRALGDQGRQRLVDFVRGGGGYLGVCAGAYLAASEPRRYGLGLAAVRCVDTAHWKRGTGIVRLSVLPGFEALTGVEGESQRMVYANGPLLETLDVAGLPGVEPLLRFESDLHQGDAPAGMMPGKLAALRTHFADGRVVLFSTHPELTEGFEGALARSVLWVARRSLR